MRTYSVLFTDHGRYLNWPGQVLRTKKRILHACLDAFRRYWGGRPASGSWGKDGFMAQAWDRSKRGVEITQINDPRSPYDDLCVPPLEDSLFDLDRALARSHDKKATPV